MSPLQPLSIRDLIWLKTYREQKQKAEEERFKLELEIQQERAKSNYLILCDLRQLLFSQLGFGKDDELEMEKAWAALPTMRDMGYKPKLRSVGVSRGVKKAEAEAKARGEN